MNASTKVSNVPVSAWHVACFASLLACAAIVHTQDRIQLQLDTSEAEAVLLILGHRTAGEPIAESDWQRVFASEPYRRLKQREAGRKRSFDDAEFRQFVLSEALAKRSVELERTLAAWQRADLEAAAQRVLSYLPAQAKIRAKVFPVIKPQTNSFVFELQTDPTVFLYVDPALPLPQVTHGVALARQQRVDIRSGLGGHLFEAPAFELVRDEDTPLCLRQLAERSLQLCDEHLPGIHGIRARLR